MHKFIQALDLSSAQKQSLEDYLALLQKWNKAYNLTAITQYNDMVIKHILDSLSIQPYVTGQQILDVGTGAGLPGLVLAIVFPEKQFTLLDSNGKKIRFLTQVIHDLSIKNCEAIQSRVECYHPNKTFDCITTRAFADLSKMLTLTKHLKTDNTTYLAMKANLSNTERKHFQHAKIVNLTVPGLSEKRTLIIC